MTDRPVLSRREWGRLERRALRAHDAELSLHLKELAQDRPPVLNLESSPSVLAWQFAGHRLVLGGVARSVSRQVQALCHSPVPVRLTASGRYGPFWWIALTGAQEQAILASHLQLRHDRGWTAETRVDLPVLSSAH